MDPDARVRPDVLDGAGRGALDDGGRGRQGAGPATPPGVAKRVGVDPGDAAASIDRVRSALDRWDQFADAAGVGAASRRIVAKALR